jgi:hypothetical protein
LSGKIMLPSKFKVRSHVFQGHMQTLYYSWHLSDVKL